MINVALLIISRFVSRIGTPLIGLLVVRYLGPVTYGQYASALAVTTMFGFFCDFGVHQTVLKFGSVEKHLGPILKRGGQVSLFYTLITFIAILIWVQVFNYEPLVKNLVFIQCIGFARTPLLSIVTAGLQIRSKFGRIALWNILTTVVQWAGTLFAMSQGWSVALLVALPLLASVSVVLLMVLIEGRSLGVFYQRGYNPDCKGFITESCKFGTAGTMHQIYHRGDAAILSALREPMEVGYYAIGMRIADLVNALPSIIFDQVLFPRYFRWSKLDRRRLAMFYRMMTKLMIAMGFCIAVFLIQFGATFAAFVFKMDETILRTLIPIVGIGIALHFWATSSGAVLTTDSHVISKIRIQGATAGISLVANSLCIPRFGILAAATVFTMSKLFLAVLYAREVRVKTGYQVFVERKPGFVFFGWIGGLMAGNLCITGFSPSLRGIGLALSLSASCVVFWLYLLEEERLLLRKLIRSVRRRKESHDHAAVGTAN